jgi:hypothetical protein
MDLETLCQSNSSLADRSSKSTAVQQLQDLLDFSLSHIPGVYKCTPDQMRFEITEGNYIARAQLALLHPHLSSRVSFQAFSEFSISYYCSVDICYSDLRAAIKIPCFRSYNPTGTTEYLSYPQFIFIIKLASALIKAAISGAAEAEIELIRTAIKKLPSYSSNQLMADYIFLQVKAACYRKISPPSLPEFIIAQALKGNCQLRDDTKEYLESYLMYIKGEISETIVPVEYYTAVIRSEKKMPWEAKSKFAEMESKAVRSGRQLKCLPRIMLDMEYVEVGEDYTNLQMEINKSTSEFEASIERFNECVLM